MNSLSPKTAPDSANQTYRLPPKLFDARCAACWFMLGLAALTIASFWSLDLQWAKFLSVDALRKMGRFIAELLTPSTDPAFLLKLAGASLETIAMSALGTLLAAVAGLALALPASRSHPGDPAYWRAPTRLLLNGLRAIPELVWAALLIISAGLGPFAGTLALALHTSGVLGRSVSNRCRGTPMRIPAMPPPRAPTKSGTATSALLGSSGSWPASTCIIRAQSSAVQHIGPP